MFLTCTSLPRVFLCYLRHTPYELNDLDFSDHCSARHDNHMLAFCGVTRIPSPLLYACSVCCLFFFFFCRATALIMLKIMSLWGRRGRGGRTLQSGVLSVPPAFHVSVCRLCLSPTGTGSCAVSSHARVLQRAVWCSVFAAVSSWLFFLTPKEGRGCLMSPSPVWNLRAVI